MDKIQNRVAITGMGALCGLGHDLNTVWKNIIEGKPGISKMETSPCDFESFPVKIAGEVKNFKIDESLLSEKENERYDQFIAFALHSAQEAYKHSGLLDNPAYPSEKVGSIIGTGMGGMPYMEKNYESFKNKGFRRVSPFFVPAIIPNMAPGIISLKLGVKGVNYSVNSACASAGHAITAAAQEIMLGRQDAMITGGVESCLSNLPISGFINMKALSRTEDPETASRPFDKSRNGFVIGEGAGILVLENLEKAKARGATIYAELVGFGSTSDAHHITAPHPEGEGAGRCIDQALNDAGLNPEDIGYVNAHGTSTPLGDLAETKAIKKTFGRHAKNLKVSSTKSMTGHLLGAAGGIETIFCAMALYEGIIPPTINLNNPDPECDLDYVANTARKEQVEYALNNSFGFGGTNSSLILKRYNP